MSASQIAKTLLSHVADDAHHSSAKVTVVGTGQVGMAAAFAMMTQVCGLGKIGQGSPCQRFPSLAEN